MLHGLTTCYELGQILVLGLCLLILRQHKPHMQVAEMENISYHATGYQSMHLTVISKKLWKLWCEQSLWPYSGNAGMVSSATES